METQNVMKELLYLGTGYVVVSKHKVEQLIDSLIANNEITREEGKTAVDIIVGKSMELKDEWQKRKDEVIDGFSEKTNLAKEEVSHFFEELLDKPKQGKEQLELKYHDIVNAISLSTSMAKHDAEELVKNFTNEVDGIWKKYETKSEDLAQEITETLKKAKATGNTWVTGIVEKLHESTQNFNVQLDNTLHAFLEKMHIASKEDLSNLEDRVTGLEKSDASK